MLTVLLVDDDPVARHLTASVLKLNRMRCVVAADACEAFEQIAAGPPDVVLLDIQMPGASGLEVLAKLKDDAATRDTPVLMLTSSDNEADIVQGIRLGARDYIIKPFAETDLVSRVLSAVLERSIQRIAAGVPARGERVDVPVEQLNSYIRRNAARVFPLGLRSPRVVLGEGTLSLFAYADFPELNRNPRRRGLTIAKRLMKERPVWVHAEIRIESGDIHVRFTGADVGGEELTPEELDFVVTEYVLPHLPPATGLVFRLWPGVETLEIHHSHITVVASGHRPGPVAARAEPSVTLVEPVAAANPPEPVRIYWR